MEYNRSMEKIKIAIIGGGASGLILAGALANHTGVILFERGERLGRKLSATGNGQGNLTNAAVRETEYFSVSGSREDIARAHEIIKSYDNISMQAFFASLGVLCATDERGRVYPSGRQASSLTDALRYSLQGKGIDVRTQTQIVRLEKAEGGFLLHAVKEGQTYALFAERVVLCTGGKAAKNFGTDGTAYALAQGLGHSVTPLYPSLVQLKTDTKWTKTLKGIRVNDGVLTAEADGKRYTVQGDIIFTDYGVSGDAVFRLSAYVVTSLQKGCTLTVDFLPDFTKKQIYDSLQSKRKTFPTLSEEELLFGTVNNQVGRAILRRASGDLQKAAELVKAFPLTATGSLGFDYAQVTKGGIPLSEVTGGLESRFAKGLYFAGEGLDIDGPCGGFNLQWAYSSARLVAQKIDEERGQVCV